MIKTHKKQQNQSKNLLKFKKNDLIQPVSQSLVSKNSVLLSNRLTKNYFSLHDTSLQNRSTINKNQLKQAVRSMVKIKDIKSKLQGRYHSQKSLSSKSYHNITQTFIPRFSLKKIKNTTQTPGTKRINSTTQLPRNNKFTLLFKQTDRKTISQRKKERLSRKISEISAHNKFLQTLKPKLQPPLIIQKPKPRGTIIQKQRIIKLVRNLIKYLNLYFNMYQEPVKVANVLRSVEGWNNNFKDIFIENYQAKFITKDEDILNSFWVFKEQSTRPETYGEMDLYLFNILQNFYFKMQKSYNDIKKNFIHFQNVKVQKVKKQIARKLSINEKKLDSNNYNISKQLGKIVEFIDNRRRHNQGRRQASLTKLESLGVRFNVQQRSKQLIVRQKEKIMKNILVRQFKK